MTRRYKPPKKKKGGVLIGMRSGVQHIAGKVVGSGDDGDEAAAAPKSGWSKVWGIAWNVLTGALLVVAVAVFLRRCGVIKF